MNDLPEEEMAPSSNPPISEEPLKDVPPLPPFNVALIMEAQRQLLEMFQQTGWTPASAFDAATLLCVRAIELEVLWNGDPTFTRDGKLIDYHDEYISAAVIVWMVTFYNIMIGHFSLSDRWPYTAREMSRSARGYGRRKQEAAMAGALDRADEFLKRFPPHLTAEFTSTARALKAADQN